MKTTKQMFLYVDLSGRGIKSRLSQSDILTNWTLSDIDDNDVVLKDFILESELGDTFETNSYKLTNI